MTHDTTARVDFYSTVTTPRCAYCGMTGEIDVPNSGLVRRSSGALIQDAFPDLEPELREQILTGTHPECWHALFDGVVDDPTSGTEEEGD